MPKTGRGRQQRRLDRPKARRVRGRGRVAPGQRQGQQAQAAEHRDDVVGDVGRRVEHRDQPLGHDLAAHVDDPEHAEDPAAGLGLDLRLQPTLDHRVGRGDREPGQQPERRPFIRALKHRVQQRARRADGGGGGEGAGMPDRADIARRQPAAEEEPEEMRRAEQADLRGGEAPHDPRQCVERPQRAGAELDQQDRQEQGGEGNQGAHGMVRGESAPLWRVPANRAARQPPDRRRISIICQGLNRSGRCPDVPSPCGRRAALLSPRPVRRYEVGGAVTFECRAIGDRYRRAPEIGADRPPEGADALSAPLPADDIGGRRDTDRRLRLHLGAADRIPPGDRRVLGRERGADRPVFPRPDRRRGGAGTGHRDALLPGQPAWRAGHRRPARGGVRPCRRHEPGLLRAGDDGRGADPG